jgi:hypothetical protein
MARLEELKARILADGKIDDAEVDLLRTELYADGKIDRDEVDLLVALRTEAKEACPAFDGLFVRALKDNLLADGVIDADEVAWLRKLLYADGKIDALEKKLLSELRAEARQVCPEFQQLLDECARA